MANAQIDNFVLDIDPNTASWGYTLNTRTYDTYGGRVVQILSSSIDTLTIGGYLKQATGKEAGKYENRFANMKAFEAKVKQIMLKQADQKQPVQFRYPALGWEGRVYLKGYSDVKYDVGTSVCSYRLTFDVESGFEGVTITPDPHGLEVIPAGVNWVRNQYNTPTTTTWQTIKDALENILNDAGTANEALTLGEAINDVLEGKDAGATSSNPVRGTQGLTKQDFLDSHYKGHINQLIK